MPGVASIESEDELVEVGLQVFASQAVIDAQRPRLEVGEDAMDAGQNDVGGHGSDDMGLVGDVRRAEIGGEPIGFEEAAGGGVRGDEGMQGGPGEIGDRRETQAPERESFLPLTTSTAPMSRSLPSWLRPAAGGSSLVRNGIVVSSASTRPESGVRSGAIIAALSFIDSSQAVS